MLIRQSDGRAGAPLWITWGAILPPIWRRLQLLRSGDRRIIMGLNIFFYFFNTTFFSYYFTGLNGPFILTCGLYNIISPNIARALPKLTTGAYKAPHNHITKFFNYYFTGLIGLFISIYKLYTIYVGNVDTPVCPAGGSSFVDNLGGDPSSDMEAASIAPLGRQAHHHGPQHILLSLFFNLH